MKLFTSIFNIFFTGLQCLSNRLNSYYMHLKNAKLVLRRGFRTGLSVQIVCNTYVTKKEKLVP